MSTIVLSMPHIVILYLEPATSGVVLQILLGGVTGLLVIVKLFWYRLASIFRWRPGARDPEPGRNEVDPDGQDTDQR